MKHPKYMILSLLVIAVAAPCYAQTKARDKDTEGLRKIYSARGQEVEVNVSKIIEDIDIEAIVATALKSVDVALENLDLQLEPVDIDMEAINFQVSQALKDIEPELFMVPDFDLDLNVNIDRDSDWENWYEEESTPMKDKVKDKDKNKPAKAKDDKEKLKQGLKKIN